MCETVNLLVYKVDKGVERSGELTWAAHCPIPQCPHSTTPYENGETGYDICHITGSLESRLIKEIFHWGLFGNNTGGHGLAGGFSSKPFTGVGLIALSFHLEQTTFPPDTFHL